jgi:hypothetical protein
MPAPKVAYTVLQMRSSGGDTLDSALTLFASSPIGELK